MNKKRGTSLIITPLITVILTLFIITIGVQTLNYIKPFIYYEKLNNISLKYLFVIQKYGYLTETEINNLKLDLKKAGFNLDNTILECPKKDSDYGTLINFTIKYKLDLQTIKFDSKDIKYKKEPIILKVSKNCYSKR